MAKWKCSINGNIKSEYLFIWGVKENVEWPLCKATFFIAHGDQSDVINPVKTKNHKLAVENKASNKRISNYLSTRNISELEKQLLLAAQETAFAYHTAVHNHTFRFMDCTTIIMRKLVNDKCTCWQTQCSAIITSVNLPFATKQILQAKRSSFHFFIDWLI
jgi:hypothetical protein